MGFGNDLSETFPVLTLQVLHPGKPLSPCQTRAVGHTKYKDYFRVSTITVMCGNICDFYW